MRRPYTPAMNHLEPKTSANGYVVCISLVAASAVFAQGDYGVFCPGAPMPRLVDGQQGRVTPGLPNLIRSQPGRGWNSAVVGQIPAGGVSNVIYGYAAQCGDGMWWFYVNYNGIVGWTAEGRWGEYWLQPF